MTVTVLPHSPADPLFGQAGGLFDAYRCHYGRSPSPSARDSGWRARWPRADCGWTIIRRPARRALGGKAYRREYGRSADGMVGGRA
jgi:hypothetical protein